MEAVTYSLRGEIGSSDKYYADAAAFTDKVLAKAEELHPAVKAFQAYILKHEVEKVRSRDEYVFELLMLGTLWRNYCDDAHNLPGIPRQLLIGLSDIRRYGGSIKQAADIARGVLATIFLSPVDRSWSPRPTPEHLIRLLDWMAATGDYIQEVKRLRAWSDFWSCCRPKQTCGEIAAAIEFAGWFESRSMEALGKYTLNVDRFLQEKQLQHRWKEDVVFSARRRVEYHLNMVGAEIMNRAFREEFLKAGNKAVVLPACIRYHPKPKCQARSNGLSCECAGCEPRCQVNMLVKLGKKHSFDVHLAPHESAVFSGEAGRRLIGENTGIIGVVCVTNLISGGWKAKGMGMPPQCVLLDHCGCRKHWHEQGIPTDINFDRLKKILDIAPDPDPVIRTGRDISVIPA